MVENQVCICGHGRYSHGTLMLFDEIKDDSGHCLVENCPCEKFQKKEDKE